jgi:transcriptional regulator with XRE-family HTH domain
MRAKSLLRCLGEELRERRKELNLSQEALADQAGLHTNVIGRIERGVYNPSVLVLFAVATRLGISLSELLAASERRA